jgi:hypothetical protein
MTHRIWMPLECEYQEAAPFLGTEHMDYSDFVAECNRAADIFSRKGMPFEMHTISIGAMKQRMTDLGMPCDTLDSAKQSVRVIMQSDFPLLEKELREIAEKTGFS